MLNRLALVLGAATVLAVALWIDQAYGQELADPCAEIGYFAGVMMNDRQFNSDQEEAARADFGTALGIASGSEEGQMLIKIFNGAWDSPLVAPNLRETVITDYAATITNRCRTEGW